MKRDIEMKRFRRKEIMKVMQKQKIYHNSDSLRVSAKQENNGKRYKGGKRDRETEK